jgi:hypothetical protein
MPKVRNYGQGATDSGPVWRALNNRIWLEVGTNSTALCQSRLQSKQLKPKTGRENRLIETSRTVADLLSLAGGV